MLKQALSTTVFAAGVLIAGAALAQPMAPSGNGYDGAGTADTPCRPASVTAERVTTMQPGGHVGNGGRVAHGGYVGQAEYHQQQIAQYQPEAGACAYNNTSAANTDTPRSAATMWQANNRGMAGPATRARSFTFALNDLYSHGFRDVHRMWMNNGTVQARAITPNDVQQVVTVDPATGQISMG